MAALAGDLSKQILGHSESTKAFRPWWDNIEDQILYAGMTAIKYKPIEPRPECDYSYNDKRPILVFNKLTEHAKIPMKANAENLKTIRSNADIIEKPSVLQ